MYDLCNRPDANWDFADPGARDGNVLYAFPGKSFLVEIPFSGAQFLDAHGEGHRLAYADTGKWTGEPLPLPTACPEVPEVDLCGGNCGGCPAGQLCTGRSPLHPWSFCISETAGNCTPVNRDFQCEVGEGCFTYTVQPEQQPIADGVGICLPTARCNAAAAGLPGGGKCYD